MPQAWLVRAVQRQELVDEVMRKIYEKEYEKEDEGGIIGRQKFCCDLIAVILLEMREDQITDRVAKTKLEPASKAEEFFILSILKPLGIFARTESEKKFLIAEILERVVASFTRDFRHALAYEEAREPVKVFNAPSATAEIELT